MKGVSGQSVVDLFRGQLDTDEPSTFSEFRKRENEWLSRCAAWESRLSEIARALMLLDR
jgi:hypothetical protein